MASSQAIPFTRQYNSFRNGLPSGYNSGSTGTTNNNRSSLSSKHGKGVVRPTVAPTVDETPAVDKSNAALTPRLSRRASGSERLANAHTIASKLKIESSPLRSPQIIRSTRMTNGVNKVAATNGVKGCSLHAKSPGSSGTSVESIVPKYGNNSALLNRTNNVYNGSVTATPVTNGGPQKRAYNINNTSTKPSNKIINTRSSGGSCASSNSGKPLPPHPHVHITNQHANNNTTHLKTHTNINGNNNNSIIGKKSKENFTSYSSKYPNGLPFEDEFYHRRKKSLSETSSSNTLSSDSSSDHRPFAFEDDEFSRKPSNEALYVDFTKPLFSHSGNGNTSTHEQQSSSASHSITTNTHKQLVSHSKKCPAAVAASAKMTKSATTINNNRSTTLNGVGSASNKNPLAEYNRRIVLSSSSNNIHHHQPQHQQLYLNNNNNAKNHGLYKENGVASNGHAHHCNINLTTGKIFSVDCLESVVKKKVGSGGKPVAYVPATAWVTENGKVYRHDKQTCVEHDPDYDSDEGVESDEMDPAEDYEYVSIFAISLSIYILVSIIFLVPMVHFAWKGCQKTVIPQKKFDFFF